MRGWDGRSSYSERTVFFYVHNLSSLFWRRRICFSQMSLFPSGKWWFYLTPGPVPLCRGGSKVQDSSRCPSLKKRTIGEVVLELTCGWSTTQGSSVTGCRDWFGRFTNCTLEKFDIHAISSKKDISWPIIYRQRTRKINISGNFHTFDKKMWKFENWHLISSVFFSGIWSNPGSQ